MMEQLQNETTPTGAASVLNDGLCGDPRRPQEKNRNATDIFCEAPERDIQRSRAAADAGCADQRAGTGDCERARN